MIIMVLPSPKIMTPKPENIRMPSAKKSINFVIVHSGQPEHI
jgi:hypothetical protein